MRRMINLLLGAFLGLAAFSFTDGHAVADVKGTDLVVTIDADQLPFKEVLADISRQTKWNIVVDEKLVDKPIAGNFANIGLDSFLKRTLKGENLIVLYDEGSKTVDIRSFGGTGKMLKISPNPVPSQEDEEKLLALRLEEQRIYDAYMSNPASIEPLTGMTLGEIAALQAKEQKVYDEYLANPNSVEPLTGMKLSQIKTLHAEEQKAYDKYMTNPDSIEPLTGMTLREIADLRDKEEKLSKELITNLNLMPQTGAPLKED